MMDRLCWKVLIRPVLWLNRNPICFQGGSFQVVYFGLFAAANTFVTASVFMYYVQVRGVTFPCGPFWTLAVCMGGNVLGVKLYHLIAMYRKGLANTAEYLNQTTMYSQGGILGVYAALLILAWTQHLDGLVAVDAAAYGAAIGLAIGRLGCYNYGCCYGKPSASRCAVVYTHPQAKVLRQHPHLKGVPLVPTQIYSAAVNLLIFVLLTCIAKYLPYNGLVTLMFLLAYSAFRILIDRFRGRADEPAYARVALGMIGLAAIHITVYALVTGQLLPRAMPELPINVVGYIQHLGSHTDVLVACLGLGFVAFVFYGLHGKTLGRHLG